MREREKLRNGKKFLPNDLSALKNKTQDFLLDDHDNVASFSVIWSDDKSTWRTCTWRWAYSDWLHLTVSSCHHCSGLSPRFSNPTFASPSSPQPSHEAGFEQDWGCTTSLLPLWWCRWQLTDGGMELEWAGGRWVVNAAVPSTKEGEMPNDLWGCFIINRVRDEAGWHNSETKRPLQTSSVVNINDRFWMSLNVKILYVLFQLCILV